MLETRVLNKNDVIVIEVQGRVDSSNAGELGEVLAGVIDDGQHQLVLDLGAVDYMSSAGLREMVAALKKLRNRDGDMRIAQVTERVYDVLELSGLNTIFQIFENQAEAVSSF